MSAAAIERKKRATDDIMPARAEPKRPKKARKPMKKATMVKNSARR